MIVVDTNVIAALILRHRHAGAARRLLQEDREWAAPLIWRSEFRNVLATGVRRGWLDLSTALAAMETADSLMHGCEYAVADTAVLIAAADSGCTAYDCEFAVLAHDLGVSLVTQDRQILEAFPEQARPLSAR